MHAEEKPIYQFLEGQDKNFFIPVYQRDYAWKIHNCRQLWKDIKEICAEGKNHFLGTIVTISDDEAPSTFSVIDGQQRLTTISILLIALSNYVEKKQEGDENKSNLPEQINDFLINKYIEKGDNKRVRLKPNKNDKEFFEKLFKGEVENNDSNITNNYHFFLNAIEKEELEPVKILDAIKKLNVVLINLNRKNDNPQLIFESINSTGVELTSADLIRNYILMELKEQTQENMYNSYWRKIEQLTGENGTNLSNFIRDYLTLKNKKVVKQKAVYEEFKEYTKEAFNEREDILKELLYFAQIYCYFISKAHDDSEITERLENFRILDNTVAYPYFLAVFDNLKKDILTLDEVKKILQILESLLFRRIVISGSTQGFNKVFSVLHKDIEKERNVKEPASYLEVFKFILLNKSGTAKFQTNEELKNAFIHNDIYHKKYTLFLLHKLENFASAYKVEKEDLTIEHIMPQKLTETWKRNLGDNSNEIHQKYLHTLGNLSLTAKNSELSNKTMKEKQKIEENKLTLNCKLADTVKWDGEAIEDRSKLLVQDILKIWIYPETNYSSNNIEDEKYDLTFDEEDFSFLKPKYIVINNNELQVGTWKDFTIKICKNFYEYSPTEFNKIIKSDEFENSFSERKETNGYCEFVTGKFVDTGKNANSLIKFLSNLCDKINYPPEDILFTITKSKKTNYRSI